MAGDLSEIHERLAFCEKEVSLCQSELDAYYIANIESRTTPVGATSFIEGRCLNPFPISIRSRVGSTAHETRATLDELACRLAVRNGKSVSGTYFPIIKTADDFEKEAKYKLRKLSDADKATITSLATHGENRPFLFGMHDLDRIRKHQRSFITLTATTDLAFGNGMMIGSMAYQRAVLTSEWTQIIVCDSRSSLDVRIGVDAVFSEPPQLLGMHVMECLRRFIKETREIVLLFD